jgi:hypothetical protein
MDRVCRIAAGPTAQVASSRRRCVVVRRRSKLVVRCQENNMNGGKGKAFGKKKNPLAELASGGSSALSALMDDERSALASVAGGGSGYDSNVETYRKPPRWLKSLVDTEEDETRVINYAVNFSLVVGTGVFFGFKFFALDADLWRGWTLAEILATVPRDNWSLYEASLASHPVISKACISGLVYGLGDLTAQTYEGKSIGSLDRGRMIRSSLTGFLAHGPASHFWYIFCDQLCAPLGDGWVGAGSKLLLDQTVWAFIWLSMYYTVLGLLSFDTPEKIVKTFKASFLPVCLVGWRFWPFVHIFTYGLIPQQHRLLWVDVCEIVWVTILSYVGNQKRKEALEVAQEAVGEGSEDVSPVSVIGQLSCALPSAVSGGMPAEEIARSMESERQVCITNDQEDICAPAEVIFSSESFDEGETEK